MGGWAEGGRGNGDLFKHSSTFSFIFHQKFMVRYELFVVYCRISFDIIQGTYLLYYRSRHHMHQHIVVVAYLYCVSFYYAGNMLLPPRDILTVNITS